MKKIFDNKFFIIFFLFIFFFHQFIFQSFFPNINNLVGHDYEMFVPNLIFGKIWFSNNFLSVPWFTPSFCCGIPFFADPQSMYYSIPQIIFLIFNPILSLKIIFFILSAFGYLGMFFLVRKNFKFNVYVSLLCASLFLFNGFFVYRAIAGHFAYLSYIFIPLFCFFLIQSFENKGNNLNYLYLVLSGLVFANFFHSGSGPIILIIFTSIFLILLFYSHLINNLKIFFNLVLSLILGTLISLSKITAGLFFLNNFPRLYPPTEFNSFASYIKTFFFSFFLSPREQHFNENISSMFPFGVHEMEYGVSLVPIVLLLFLFLLNKNLFRLKYYNIRFIILLIIIFFIPILLNVNFLDQNQLIKKIPILKSSWVQFRWMAVYILPIIIISGLVIENLKFDSKNKNYLAIFLIFILLFQNLTRDKSWHLNDQKYNMKNATTFYLNLKKGIAPKIIGPAILMDKSGSPKIISNKNDMFFHSLSPLACYQPIFGYGLEQLNAKKIIFNSKKIYEDNSFLLYSDKFDKKDNNLMFFNPSCFLFPEENNCSPGDTFKISDKDKLIDFTNYRKFEFRQNKMQVIANYISVITIFGCLLYLIYFMLGLAINFRKI
tara:strand:+ start:50 stop:1858 length:1809 start_codon:yes stop_codon:yes gene_type:complete